MPPKRRPRGREKFLTPMDEHHFSLRFLRFTFLGGAGPLQYAGLVKKSQDTQKFLYLTLTLTLILDKSKFGPVVMFHHLPSIQLPYFQDPLAHFLYFPRILCKMGMNMLKMREFAILVHALMGVRTRK